MAQTSRLVLEIDSRDAEQKAADTRKALEALESASIRVKPAMDKAGAGMGGAAESSDKAGKSFKGQSEEIEALLGRLDPLRRKQEELRKSQAQLAQAFKGEQSMTPPTSSFPGSFATKLPLSIPPAEP